MFLPLASIYIYITCTSWYDCLSSYFSFLLQMHYYQPMWTLVGAGAKTVSASGRSTASVMPSGVKWVKSKVMKLDPKNNTVFTESGKEVRNKQNRSED